MKKVFAILVVVSMVFTLTCCTTSESAQVAQGNEISGDKDYLDTSLSIEQRVSDLISSMTLEQKAAQMVQCEQGFASRSYMENYCFGSILSG